MIIFENKKFIFSLFIIKKLYIFKNRKNLINPLTSPGEVVSVFTSPYLSAVAPALGEAKGLIKRLDIFFSYIILYIYFIY